MSNHLGDTNKMVSETPRMDSALRKAQEDYTESYLLTEGLKLERELNAANERIKQLEESENRMLNWLTEDCPEAVKKQLSNAWMKSKEAKP
jgi:flagellar motility protein MotE (MotC chaperone)